MKCELSEDGMMIIYAENSLESYALGKWFNGMPTNCEQAESGIGVDLVRFKKEKE